jgi:hypothetical protein
MLRIHEHSRFYFECLNFAEAAKEYVSRVDRLLDEMAEAHGEDEYGLYTKMIPSLHWTATAIYIYANLEQRFTEACEIVKATKSLDLTCSKFQGQGIPRAKLYLVDYAKLHLKITKDVWEHVALLGKLRNSLVHGGFSAQHENYAPLSAYAARTSAFRVSGDSIVVTRKTVEHALSVVAGVLDRLGEAVYVLQR